MSDVVHLMADKKILMEIRLTIRMDKTLKTSLQKLANADKRKLSDYIRVQLEKIVEQSKTQK
jgi:predicted transcriptional regulator